MQVKGRVVSGAKEGAYFISIYKDKIQDKTGFHPFPGTLNIESNTYPVWSTKAEFISAWTQGDKEFGAVWIYPCDFKGTEAAVVVPDLTRHSKNIVELISPHCLRTKFDLKDGDYVDFSVQEVK